MKELMIDYPHTQTSTTKTWQNGSQSFVLQLSYNGKNGTTPRALQLLYDLLHLSYAISTQTHKHEGRKVTIICSSMVVALYLDYRSYYGITMHSNQYQNKLKDKQSYYNLLCSTL
jgi:hypothetical protein